MMKMIMEMIISSQIVKIKAMVILSLKKWTLTLKWKGEEENLNQKMMIGSEVTLVVASVFQLRLELNLLESGGLSTLQASFGKSTV